MQREKKSFHKIFKVMSIYLSNTKQQVSSKIKIML